MTVSHSFVLVCESEMSSCSSSCWWMADHAYDLSEPQPLSFVMASDSYWTITQFKSDGKHGEQQEMTHKSKVKVNNLRLPIWILRPLLYSQNRKANFAPFSYPSDPTPPKLHSLEKRIGISDLVIRQILLPCHRFSSHDNFTIALNPNIPWHTEPQLRPEP